MLLQHTLALIITTITTFGVAIFVLRKGPQPRTNIEYALYILSIGWWSIFQIFASTASNYETALLLWRVDYVGVIVIPVLFLRFVIGLDRSLFKRVRIPLFSAAYAHCIFFTIVNLKGDLIQDVAPKGFHTFYGVSSNIYNFFLIGWIAIVCCCLAALLVLYKRADTRQRKLQYGYFTFSMIVAYVGGASNYLPVYDIYVPVLMPFGTYLVPLHLGVTAYAIIAHGLMDIKVFIRKTFVYTTLILSLSLVYLVFVFGTYNIILSQAKEPPSVYLNFLALFIIASLYKPLEIMIQRFMDKVFFKGTIAEISDQKEQLETELERRERLKSVGILAAGMAHEIKNPITTIKTFLEYLPEKHNDREYLEKYVRIVGQETERIKSIVNDLLLFSKPKEPVRAKVHIKHLIRNVTSLLSNACIKQKIKVVDHLEGIGDYVLVDAEQIKQALLNIVLNAIEAMKGSDARVLTLSGSTDQGWTTISIQDTGSGISEDKLTNIFDPFYTSKDEGAGLGLAITHAAIEKNGGKIIVESKLHVGTTFTISLPADS